MFGGRRKIEASFPALTIEQCLAKTIKQPDGVVIPGRNILEHCHIVGEVAKEILARMPDWIRKDLFPDGSDLIAACHDIGKISPTFQRKIYEALSLEDKEILSGFKGFEPSLEKQWGGHAGVSQLTAGTQDIGPWIPTILGQHHGVSPNPQKYRGNDDIFGGEPWLALRIEIVSRLKKALGTDFPLVKNALQTRVLSGLTTVSDWIGSGSFFIDPKDMNWKVKIPDALDCAGFIHPELKPGLSFEGVFGFPPKDQQVRFFETANEHGVYILEAPMGSGKTEAALYAAYRMMEKKQATGLYFALPTQLTSNKIHDRVNAFLSKVLLETSPHKKALLLHGSAWLKEKEIGEEGSPGRSWFDQRKRGILAPFAVGTIDQALMAVMNVRHGFVRAFGLAGKVVILDEVHSYDSFTGTLLDALVKELRSLHCTVIILSATLTKERRSSLIEVDSRQDAYPLITAQQKENGPLIEIVSEKESDVYVEIAHRSEEEAIDEALKRSEEYQQVLWIENSVKDSQDIFRILSARGKERGIVCGLLHSRFTKSDRSINEDRWVHFYGKNNPDRRLEQGRILVGTQVLEQSLDIDSDFLVTRIAPTDMLLQRIGRLWRHEETKRPDLASRETWILSPVLDSVMDSPEGFGRTAKIYAPYVLCRTLMVWEDLLKISIPGDVRKLIEETYSERQDENEAMIRYFQQVIKKREDLRRLALLGLATEGKTQSDENAMTRHNTIPEVDVLLLRSCHQDALRKTTIVRLLDGSEISVPLNGSAISPNERRSISARLMQDTLRVPFFYAPGGGRPEWLKDYFYLGDKEETLLRIGLLSEDGEVRSVEHRYANDRYAIRYDAVTGYQTTKR
ncbi:CRISPR-associated helicase Cas3, protein [Leptospirillum ferriphilum]|uniref:CRISPR-associated helicase Cas3, protein n=1 Tax=Leptospirillum ferriphilum TaxID=178606 RepID=A0A094WE29_9BACT|nr:CRISPR-associated helicase/endonuclease Cas3 [Leptospirillum ferriphilum]KGA93897.1 CRISPR-associated helicase Cas3, protein [Leptospirillum ferriphilum]